MTPLSVITMIVICGVVWGGLCLLIVHAVRSEARRNRKAQHEAET